MIQQSSPLVTLLLGWIVASGITLACVFGLYDRQQTLIEACFYNSLSRTCFACGVAWVIFVCVSGQGGVVNSILSWESLDSSEPFDVLCLSCSSNGFRILISFYQKNV
ncbi:nose resistant to fluoxetine protein 6 [Caerostris extrusa]|uniref:Nose resistant to fluoxetine protein 6 n=1 Tax=Caerostris extrusa TaxID=172846 RepID=A0AAV4ST35_CAEEX|nr:nose resistant to fluoxetine protein 6 [Caerostris extrusa]